MTSLIRTMFRTSPDSLACQQRASDDIGMRWFPWINLVWSVWLFVTPFYADRYQDTWLWPTLGSYVVFLFLFQRFHYDKARRRLGYTLAIAALGFAVLPYNPGSQSYVIYACAFFPLCMSARRALAAIVALLIVFAAVWHEMGIPMIYMSSAVIAGLVVGVFNIGMLQKLRSEAQLRLSHEEVRRLAALAERERIGRDLHDLLGHTLSLVALKSNLASRLIGHDPMARGAGRPRGGDAGRPHPGRRQRGADPRTRAAAAHTLSVANGRTGHRPLARREPGGAQRQFAGNPGRTGGAGGRAAVGRRSASHRAGSAPRRPGRRLP